MKLDCLGDMCPIPLMKAQKAAAGLLPGNSFLLVTDHSCVVTSMREYFAHMPFEIRIEEVLVGVWEIVVSKKHEPLRE